MAILEKTGTPIDLVLSDVIMPKMGGIPLLYTLREQGWQGPVILLSGHPREEHLEIARLHRVSGFLLKPPDPKVLAQTIAKALRD